MSIKKGQSKLHYIKMFLTQKKEDQTQWIYALHYRQRMNQSMHTLLKKLLLPIKSAFQFQSRLTILILGAGTFPSFSVFLEEIAKVAPKLEKIHFTLVEYVKADIDFFMNQFAKPIANDPSLKLAIDFSIYQGDIKTFLKQTSSTYDVIYFEHPETMTPPIILAKLGLRYFTKMVSLRESIPFIKNIVKPSTVIIASCMSYHELGQLRSLLRFSLKVKPHLVFSYHPLHFFYGGPYTHGLVCQIQPLLFFSDYSPKKYMRLIKHSDYFLCGFLFLAFILYLGKWLHPHGMINQVIALSLLYAQLLLHRPGKTGFLMQCALLLGQGLL